ncbi:hypothetical protein C8035_v002796 [Colletotrichum spinosum]|uniref:Uncharacterized protein n=1 Tax=Colletotrichum spinosum TaxID=1347390 RepID=A0A4V3HR68_9PEZI|nr:hypothetical protein C8035_v002796 [Colletotrichum spinosum]
MEHPIKRGQPPIKNFCAHCMKRRRKKSVIPTETLLGISSDGSEPGAEDGSDEQMAAEQHRTVEKSLEETFESAADQNQDGTHEDLAIPSAEVKEDRHHPSVRPEVASETYDCPPSITALKPEDDEAPGINHTPKAAFVEDASEVSEASGTVPQLGHKEVSPPERHIPSAQAMSNASPGPGPPLTPDSHVDVKEAIPEVGSSSLSSGSSAARKRATFNERVEVRTSPTYWQRQHSDSDDSYSNFHHEQYHQSLGDGQKAVPLDNPLRDPNGFRARPFESPRNSLDEDSFNSWSKPHAGDYTFATGNVGSPPLNRNSESENFNLSSLYAWEGYEPSNCSPEDQRTNSFANLGDRESSWPSDTKIRNAHHPGVSASHCNQGKENQPCFPAYRTFNGGYPPSAKQYSLEEQSNAGLFSRHQGDSDRPEPFRFTGDAFEEWGAREHRSDSQEFGSTCHGSTQRGSRCSYNTSSGNPGARLDNPFDETYYFQHRATFSSYQPGCQSDFATDHRDDDFTYQGTRQPPAYGQHSMESGFNYTSSGSYPADPFFESASTVNDTFASLDEPRLPPTGFVMEIPDDMPEAEVQTMFIPGYDDYVPLPKMNPV